MDKINKININNLSLKELEVYIESLNEKKYHAKQIFKWLHREAYVSFDDMTDISKSLRTKLKENTYISKLEIIKIQKSKDGTHKFLIKLLDQNAIEAVFMKYNYGNTICVSTQVGCKMRCKFCASTKNGWIRDLTASEIEGQIIVVQKYMNEKISNVVYMGIGEPLDNFENVVKSIEIINTPEGLGIGARHIGLSTCGIIPNIYKLADLKLQATLSISLHATTDTKRKEIMPIAEKYTIKDLLQACDYYIIHTNRRITFEFALIKDVNDNEKTAKELAKLLKGMLAHVNLIPINELKDNSYRKSKKENINKFMDILNSSGITTTVRRELGNDIDAACGQLRKRCLDKQ